MIPAQVVAEELEHGGNSIFFAGHGLLGNPFFRKERWQGIDVPAAGMQNPLSFCLKNARGFFQACSMLKETQPACVVGFGSFHVVPVLLAAWVLHIPLVLYAADAIPGRVVRLFAPMASWTGCFFDEAKSKLSGQTITVSHPLRKEFASPPSKAVSRAFFSLPQDQPVFLVVGGSQGSKALNALVPEALAQLEAPPSVIHLAGLKENLDALSAKYQALGVTSVVRSFEPSMAQAYGAADLVFTRAGTSAIAEIEAFGLPAIYVPYPHAKDGHQKVNAALAAARGRALVLSEEEASLAKLIAGIDQLGSHSKQGPLARREVPNFAKKIIEGLL